MLGFVMLRYVSLCFFCFAMFRLFHFVSFVALCCVMLRYVLLRNVKKCYVAQSCTILHNLAQIHKPSQTFTNLHKFTVIFCYVVLGFVRKCYDNINYNPFDVDYSKHKK